MIVQAVYPRTYQKRVDEEWIRIEYWEIRSVKLKNRLLHNGALTDAALDDRELFRCERCGVIFTWEFGCDFGLPDAHEVEKQAEVFRKLKHRLPSSLDAAVEADKILREFCDQCWGDVVR